MIFVQSIVGCDCVHIAYHVCNYHYC